MTGPHACELQLRRVATADGRPLGHLFDLRCEVRGDRFVITHLVVGRRGLLERLGFRRQRSRLLPWAQVIDLRGDRIVVRSGRN